MTKKLLNKKIVILDACTVSNGDVDFGTFESLGDVKIYSFPRVPDSNLSACLQRAMTMWISKPQKSAV